MADFVANCSNELLILLLVAMVLVTLIIIVPQLLKAHQRVQEMRHAERLRSLEAHIPVPPPNDALRTAGRIAVLVPSVALIVAGVVTCFLVVYRSDYVLAVTIAAWCAAGLVSLAAITGGVALVGRLAHLDADESELPPDVKT
jgi:hypothetical protein